MNEFRAYHYLSRISASERIGDIYDDDDMLQEALAVLVPLFEYPDWSHRTIGELTKHLAHQDMGN